MTESIKYRFVLKRDTAANFTAKNTILLEGEIGLELDTGTVDGKRKFKIGDGATAWNSLPYYNPGGGTWGSIIGTLADQTDLAAALDLKADVGGIPLYGRVSTYGALPDGLGSGDAGKAYLVDTDGLIYVWSGTAFPTSGAGVYVGGTRWNLLASWDFSVDGALASIEADLTMHREIMVIFSDVTTSSSAYRAFQLSWDNGTTWDTSYDYLNSSGTRNTSSLNSISVHTTSTTASRGGIVSFPLITNSESAIYGGQSLAGFQFLVKKYASRANRIRAGAWNSSGSSINMTGGSLKIYAR